MVELWLAIGSVGLLSAIGVAGLLASPETLYLAGGGLVALGLLTGLPTGLAYHVALFRCLRRRAALPSRWWLDPVALHPRLPDAERMRVLRWFLLGGAGFGIVVLGCAVTLLGLAFHWLAPVR